MTRPKDVMSDREYQESLIAAFPESDYGRAFFSYLQKELDSKTDDYFLSLKVSDEDVRQDFRFKAGVIATLKWVLREPERLRKKING